MEITDPSLWMFSLLPPEVRIKIWKHFSPYVGRSLPRMPDHHSKYQEILLASRKIYAEVAAEVPSGYYCSKIITSVISTYKYNCWIKVQNSMGVRWDLKDPQDAISRGFCDLPWHNLDVHIWIGAPSKDDPGEVICLYKKTRALVELLKRAAGFKSVWVIFKPYGGTSWFDGTKPHRSITTKHIYKSAETWARWEGEISEGQNMMSTEGKQENLNIRHSFGAAQQIMRKTTPYGAPTDTEPYRGRRIKEHIDHLVVMVEHILDPLPSKTANMLRLERFSSWYTDIWAGDSPYADELRALTLGKLGRRFTLNAMLDRMNIMMALEPWSLKPQNDLPETSVLSKRPDFDWRQWDRDAWHFVYRDDITPLYDEKTTEKYRKWCRGENAPKDGWEFVRQNDYLFGRKKGEVIPDDVSDY